MATFTATVTAMATVTATVTDSNTLDRQAVVGQDGNVRFFGGRGFASSQDFPSELRGESLPQLAISFKVCFYLQSTKNQMFTLTGEHNLPHNNDIITKILTSLNILYQ